ncbi:ester cyclase [Sandarakinorhabdus sp. DWP1-3-1]|uniref:ester cyclase n=1 Tax=Sandarakinorhabdus sp. DWP1-3-1 TaxID=2804627 RepID=UPI003CF3B608
MRRSLADLLEPGPRRQDLPGYDPVYRDFVDYIIRCTHRIWEEKNIGLCRSHYAADCAIHTLAGPVRGVEAVVQNTITTLAATPDRRLIGEDVIWSDDGAAGLYSSHRIVSTSTHMGPDALLGPATRRSNGVMTIADCLCRENRIVEEWLVRDNLRGVAQVGGDPWAVARAQAAGDALGDPSRHGWRADLIAETRDAAPVAIPAGHPAEGPAAMLALALGADLYGEAAAALSPTVEVRWPSGRLGHGRGCWIGCLTQIRAALHEVSWRLGHVAARPLPDGDIAVALRWTLAGVHRGDGLWGPASGREIVILAVSHYRLRGGSIVEDTTVFDELAVLRQVAGGLGA